MDEQGNFRCCLLAGMCSCCVSTGSWQCPCRVCTQMYMPCKIVMSTLSPCIPALSETLCSSPTAASGKKQAAKSKEELAQEKKKELEKRLQDVSGQLNNNKKPAKKGNGCGFVKTAPQKWTGFVTGSKPLPGVWICDRSPRGVPSGH